MSLMKIISENVEFFNCSCPFCPSDGTPLKVTKDRYACSNCNAMGDLVAFLMTHRFFSYQEAAAFTLIDMHRDNDRNKQMEIEELKFQERRSAIWEEIKKTPNMDLGDKQKYMGHLQKRLEDHVRGSQL